MRGLIFVAVLTVITTVGGVMAAFRIADPQAPLAARQGPELKSARTWGYQLQNLVAKQVPDSVDMMVVDYSRTGAAIGALSARDVEALRTRADGSKRIVLCYLSIGEAENYRYYWRRSWTDAPPAWLGAENAAWPGNYEVQFWQPDWQKLIFEARPPAENWIDRVARAAWSPSPSYLDRIIEAGFDGVYLDRVDAFEKVALSNPRARDDMIDFVAALSAYAKARRPGFLVVPQNAEDLLAEPRYRAVIDGVGKEDLLYGEGGDGVANKPADTRYAIGLLTQAKNEGRPVFVIEYLADGPRQQATASDLRKLGFVPVFSDRHLNVAPELPPTAALQSGKSTPVGH